MALGRIDRFSIKTKARELLLVMELVYGYYKFRILYGKHYPQFSTVVDSLPPEPRTLPEPRPYPLRDPAVEIQLLASATY